MQKWMSTIKAKEVEGMLPIVFDYKYKRMTTFGVIISAINENIDFCQFSLGFSL